jgi:alkanesulfonate monooxygenase SsuD/methylene tetrahydromethanopterin reductase-like flavin-dependent oxidoreductase (luciferase family)
MEAGRVRVSLSVTEYPRSDIREHLAAVVRAADAGGLDTVWVADHLLQAAPGTAPDDPMLEAYTTLGYLAGRSERVRLGTMVAAVTYRAPALLIKAVTSLDALSGGRAWLGVGSGYHEPEARTMGLDLPPVPERFERLEQTLQLAREMWTGAASPVPLTRPPILIGGMGERRTLRLVAQYADACNLFDIPDGGETIRRKLDVLRRHCDAVGRRFEEIEKTVSTRLGRGESAESFAARCELLRSYGIEHAVAITDGPWTLDGIAALTRGA